MKTIRRISALLMTLVLVFSLMPFTALASEDTYTVSVRGSRESSSNSGAGRYNAGETVYIHAGYRDGYIFDGWSISSGQKVKFDDRRRERTSFVMPEANVSVTANWLDEHEYEKLYDDSWYYDLYNDGWYDDINNERWNDSRILSPSANAPVNVTFTAANNAVNDAVAAATTAGSSEATVNIRNPGDIHHATLQTMANRASRANLSLRLQADSMALTGGIDVRITLNPTNATQNLNLSASTNNAQATQITNHYSRNYSNNIMAVSFGQQGNFGQTVKIAAKIATGLNTNNLVFYAYDRESNSHNRLTTMDYRIDDNGFVHFQLERAGNIIISDGPLVKR